MYISCTYDVFYIYIVLVFCHIFLSHRPIKIHLYMCMHICYVYHTSIITQIFYVCHTHMMCIVIHTCITKKADEKKPDYVLICVCVCICVCGRPTICMTGSFHTPEGVMSHTGKSHVTQQKESCRTPDRVMSHVARSFMAHMYEFCHMYRPLTRCMSRDVCVMSHVDESCLMWMSQITFDVNESNLKEFGTCWRVMSLVSAGDKKDEAEYMSIRICDMYT